MYFFYNKGYKYIYNIIDNILTFKKAKKTENKNITIIKKEKNKKNNKILVSKKIMKNRRKKNRKKFKRYQLNNSNNKSSTKLDLKKQKQLKINDNYEEYVVQEANKATEILDNKKQMNINNNNQNYEIFSYEEAIKNDKISFCEIYLFLIKTKHILISPFYPIKDYNSKILKICYFFYSFALYYFVNALFFTDKTMHKIYEDEGVFNFIYILPQIIYSSLISTVINFCVNYLSLSEEKIIEIKREENFDLLNKKVPDIKKCLKIQFILFFIVSFIFLTLFWYYLACFGAIYKNTQIYLLKDTLISFSLSLLYPFIIYLVPAIFRITILKYFHSFLKINK